MERRDLAIDFIFSLVLIEVLKQVSNLMLLLYMIYLSENYLSFLIIFEFQVLGHMNYIY